MGEVVMVIGKSGSGKSASMRNFKKGECLVLNVMGKRMPFPTKLDTVRMPNYAQIEQVLNDTSIHEKYNTIIIDDSTYLMQNENFARSGEKGYEKFTQMAEHFQHMIISALGDTPDDCIVYILHHPDEDDKGNVVPATAGKMLQEKFKIEGAVAVLLSAECRGGEYRFKTNKDEDHEICKSPINMFADKYIDNDLKAVDDAIRKYWDMEPRKGAK